MNREKIFSTVVVLIFLLVSFRMSARESKRTPVAVSPGSDTGVVSVWEGCPTFSWSAVDLASSYRIVVFEAVDPEVTAYEDISAAASPVIVKDIPGPALSWTLPAEERLKTGSMYSWYVQAVDAYGDALGNWSNGNIFKVEQEVLFAGVEEKLAEKMREYGVNEETISNVLNDVKSEVKEVVIKNDGSKDNAVYTQGMNSIKGTEGATNTFYGQQAGYSITSGANNTFIGSGAGYFNSTKSNNTFLGYAAGFGNITGERNSFIGSYAGYSNTSGVDNAFIGYYSGHYNSTGNFNTFIGMFSGIWNTIGFCNTFVGNQAGNANNTGNSNTYIGNYAGFSNTAGSGNVFLGNNAGFSESGSNKLYISSLNTNFPLIYGEFDNGIVGINGQLGVGTKTPLGTFEIEKTGANAVFIFERTDGAQGKFTARPNEIFIGSGSNHNVEIVANNNRIMTLTPGGYVGIGTSTPSYPLHMASGAYCSTGGTWTNASSRSLKENICDLTNAEAVEALFKLNPVKYNYKVDITDKHVGFIAEDVPELVATADRKGLSPMDVTAVLTKVVQEQQKIILDLQKRLTKLEKEK